MDNSKLGTSLAFDLAETLQVGYRGQYKLIEGSDNVRQAIWLRLNTPIGALVLHPEYGNQVYDLISEPMDENWPTRAVLVIRECLSHEPRIDVNDVQVELFHEERKARFSITYTILGEPRPENVVWEVSYESGV